MAEYLASIFGTEKDKVNCSFFFKIGACTHGERCSRIHNRPTFSQTILLQNLYINPQNSAKTADGSHLANVTDEEMQEHYDNFFEDVFVECEDKYGPVEEMNVCDNLGDHLVGNVYVKFKKEEDADKAHKDLNNRWFGGRPVYAELTPVTDFREACCRQYETGECTRSGFCNFMHLKPISRKLRSELYGRGNRGGYEPLNNKQGGMIDLKDELEMEKKQKRERSPRDGGGGGGGDRDRRRDRSRDRGGRRERSRDRDSRHRGEDGEEGGSGSGRMKDERSDERGGRY